MQPAKIIGVERNYGDAERTPRLFLRPAGCVIGPGDEIALPAASRQVVAQCEIGVVIGRPARRLTPEEAAGAIRGYVCLNDVTAFDLFRDPNFGTTAKWFDTFMPMGTEQVDELPTGGATMTTSVNEEELLRGHSSRLMIGIENLVSWVSHFTSLDPGDVVMTGGAPSLVRIVPGDTVEVAVEGIGALQNPVVAGGGPEYLRPTVRR